jgi:hypothetical protein
MNIWESCVAAAADSVWALARIAYILSYAGWLAEVPLRQVERGWVHTAALIDSRASRHGSLCVWLRRAALTSFCIGRPRISGKTGPEI